MQLGDNDDCLMMNDNEDNMLTLTYDFFFNR